jgi:ferrous iron transport protein B
MTVAIDVALAGNPNSGKTTLFNRLTGSRQHVGNYPGVTVEKKEGRCRHQDRELALTDLPGTYSLTAYTEEEIVAREFLINTRPKVINITDASNLERNLYLTLQLLEIGIPVIIALNMIDVAKQRGIQIDACKLSLRLGIPVVPIIARSGKGSVELLGEVVKELEQPDISPLSISYGEDIDNALNEMGTIISETELLIEKYPVRWIALKFLENDTQIIERSRMDDNDVADKLMTIAEKVEKHLLVTLDSHPEAMIADYRYGYIKSLLQGGVITRTYDKNRLFITDKIDAVLTNRFLGPVIMLAILFGLYKFTFTYSELPVGWFESFFGWLSDLAATTLPDGYVKSLVVSGIIDGVGGVLGFVPIIAFMFFGIAVLEDSGYLARVAYMMDRVLRIFGLHGSSVMSYIVSGGIAGGCAVPGVMAARTLRSKNERLATILTAPFMNCGAKIPVLALLIAAFFQDGQSQMMFILTLVAWLGAVLVAKFFRMTVIKGESTPFVMELPPYRLPTFQGLMIHTWERTWQYIKKAGTVILAISVLIWAMMTFPELPLDQKQMFENQRQDIAASYPQAIQIEVASVDAEILSHQAVQLKTELLDIDNMQSEKALKNSVAGRIGTALEGVSLYAGFDWRTNIALVGGFAAKEVIVATLGTAYSLGEVEAEDIGSLSDTLAKAPGWNKIAALAVILFVMFYAPCFVTVVCISRETGSWKWGLFSMAFNTAFAFMLAVSVYQVGMLYYGVP